MTIIAEIGTAHGGNLEKAYSLIDAAAGAGADCVKFQWVYADEILHPDTGFVDLPGGKTRLYDSFKALEMPPSFFGKCMERARKRGLLFACSPFGTRSLAELAALSPDAIKIASPEVNHFQLLEGCADFYGKIPLILSSGVSKLGDLERAIEILAGKNGGPNEKPGRLPRLTLLHCVTSYPAPEEEYNVRAVGTLGRIFGIPAGISDHSMDAVLVPALSAAEGGIMVEKHITLSRTDGGLDDSVALEPEQFALMAHAARQAEAVRERFRKDEFALRGGGDAEFGSWEARAEAEIIRQLENSYPPERIRAALGSGAKRLAKSEAENYGRTNRSLHYTRSFRAGERPGIGGMAALRTEKILSPGISPEFLGALADAALARDVDDGDGVRLEDFLSRAPGK